MSDTEGEFDEIVTGAPVHLNQITTTTNISWNIATLHTMLTVLSTTLPLGVLMRVGLTTL